MCGCNRVKEQCVMRILMVCYFEVIYTVCHDRKSGLLLPTLTHVISTDNLYFSPTRFGAF